MGWHRFGVTVMLTCVGPPHTSFFFFFFR
jgi:hypothetical protein